MIDGARIIPRYFGGSCHTDASATTEGVSGRKSVGLELRLALTRLGAVWPNAGPASVKHANNARSKTREGLNRIDRGNMSVWIACLEYYCNC